MFPLHQELQVCRLKHPFFFLLNKKPQNVISQACFNYPFSLSNSSLKNVLFWTCSSLCLLLLNWSGNVYLDPQLHSYCLFPFSPGQHLNSFSWLCYDGNLYSRTLYVIIISTTFWNKEPQENSKSKQVTHEEVLF